LVTLYWYNRDKTYGAELMATAQEALGRVAENSGAALSRPVSLYIYAGNADLLGALVFAQEWTGGVAFSEYNIIAIGIGSSSSEKAWGKETIFHELTHLVVHQVTYNPYSGPPPWLDEGLAMNSENEFDTQFARALDKAVADGSLISVQSLCSPFSAYADEAVLAYAQSYLIVRYLIETYGQGKMLALLNAYKNGSTNDDALRAVYGFDMASLNTQWQAAFKKSLVSP